MSDLTLESASILDEIYEFHCYVCTELFSTDPNSPTAPVNSLCGHYICRQCHEQIREPNGEGGWRFTCGLCKLSITASVEVSRARDLQDLMNSISKWTSQRTLVYEKRTFNQFLKTFPGMTCRNCHELFSVVSDDPHCPARNSCGHFICVDCDNRIATKDMSQNYSVMCSSCRSNCTSWKEKRVSYGYMTLLFESQKKLQKIWSETYRIINCSNCKQEIQHENAQICLSCQAVESKELTVVCTGCAQMNHHQPHELVEYSKEMIRENQEELEENITFVQTYRGSLSRFFTGMDLKETLQGLQKFDTLSRGLNDLQTYATIKRLGVEVEKFEEYSKRLASHLKKFEDRVKETKRNIADILPEMGDLEAEIVRENTQSAIPKENPTLIGLRRLSEANRSSPYSCLRVPIRPSLLTGIVSRACQPRSQDVFYDVLELPHNDQRSSTSSSSQEEHNQTNDL